MMEINQMEEDTNSTNTGEQEPGAETDGTMQMEEGQVHTTTVLDEQSLQQLMDSGTVSEDSIITIVQIKQEEPKTVVLSRQETEALGIQLDPVEQPVEDKQGLLTNTEELEGMAEQVDQESDMQQTEDMNKYNAENIEKFKFHQGLQAGIQSQLHAEFKSELQNDLQDELEDELQQDLQETPSQEEEIQPGIPPELQPKRQELFPVTDAELEPHVDTPVPEAISVPEENVLPMETQDAEVKTKEQVPKDDEEMHATTVSLDAVSQQLGEECGDSDSSANDVLSNIIHSLFNPNEPNQSNVSIVPRMVGGKRKLCLRLPASTARALLAQTGSPLAHSLTEGGIPKKIKIVIPPSSLSNSAGSFVTSLANSASPSSSLTATPISNPPKKPLGSAENPFQLVQEGNSLRSLQPLTPDQLKHINSVLEQNRQAILSGKGEEVPSSSEEDGVKRRVLCDAKSNTRIVYRVLTPGELKKTHSTVSATTEVDQADDDAVDIEEINLQGNEIVNQVVEGQTDKEVVNVAGPRLSAAMSSWEYLLLRVQQEDEGNSSAPLIPRILNEVTSLFNRVSSMTARHLHPHVNGGDGGGNGEEHEPYQLTNPETARLLGLQCGTYFISKDERKLLEEDAVNSA